MAEKNLNGSGLNEVWVRAAQLVKKFTGEVNLTKGDLQTQVNKKISGTDDTKNNIVTFTSGDTANPTAFKDVAVLASNENHKSILEKISNMFNNVRYLYKNVGGIKGLSSSSAITNEGQYALDAREKNASVEGTLANEINKLNSNLSNFKIYDTLKSIGITSFSCTLQEVFAACVTKLGSNQMFLFNQSALTSGITDLPAGYGQLQITNVKTRYKVLYSTDVRIWSLTDNNSLKDKTASNLVELACLSSPTFIGAPKATTASTATDNSTRIATTQFVQNAITNRLKHKELDDANNVDGGINIYLCTNAAENGTNFPSGVYGCYMLSIKENNDWGGQLLWSRDNGNKLFIRSLNNGTWGDWTEK